MGLWLYLLHCDCRDKSSYLLQPRPKRCRLVSLGHKTTSFWPFYFFKSLPKTMSFGTKSLIQTTSFWISDLKQFQNNVVLDSDNPKRRHFGMCARIKKISLPFLLSFKPKQTLTLPTIVQEKKGQKINQNSQENCKKISKTRKNLSFPLIFASFLYFYFFFFTFLMILVHDLAYANK